MNKNLVIYCLHEQKPKKILPKNGESENCVKMWLNIGMLWSNGTVVEETGYIPTLDSEDVSISLS